MNSRSLRPGSRTPWTSASAARLRLGHPPPEKLKGASGLGRPHASPLPRGRAQDMGRAGVFPRSETPVGPLTAFTAQGPSWGSASAPWAGGRPLRTTHPVPSAPGSKGRDAHRSPTHREADPGNRRGAWKDRADETPSVSGQNKDSEGSSLSCWILKHFLHC